MKGGKDEEKQMDALFPKLHINDAEKGRYRAPPRNKMALCEQLNISSQKFTSGSVSLSPFPPNSSCSLVPSASLAHDGCQRRNVFPPFCSSPRSTHITERVHCHSSQGGNLTANLSKIESQLFRPTNYDTPRPTANEFSLFQSHCISNIKNSLIKKLGNKHDIRLTAFAQLGNIPNCQKSEQNMDKGKLTVSSMETSAKHSCEKQQKQTNMTDLKSGLHMRNQTEEETKASETSWNYAEKPASILSMEKILEDASSGSLARSKILEPDNRPLESLNQKKGNNLIDDVSRLHKPIAQSNPEHKCFRVNKVLADGSLAEHKRPSKKRSASEMEGLQCGRSPLLGNNSFNALETVHECYEDQDHGSLQVGERDRKDYASDCSVVDSVSGLDISPDDVVGVIGQRQFWKARRTLVHQQRVFAVQVFQLHRLMKVQRLIAQSPELLFEDIYFFCKPPIELFPMKKMMSKNVLEPPALIDKSKIDSQKLNSSTKYAADNAVKKMSIPHLNNDTDKGPITQLSSHKTCSEKPLPASTGFEAKPTYWCYPPPTGSRWLVPVRSPSEGFVYKPCTGSCPPMTTFMAPVYGSCRPMSMTLVGGYFLNTSFGVSTSHEGIPKPAPLGQTYFPPYGMLVSSSSSAVGQGCKRSDLQHSTGSIPSEREQGDALPLFPTAPTTKISDQPTHSCSAEQRIEVIKAVPHNPKSASESVARIFQFIQEGRRQHK